MGEMIIQLYTLQAIKSVVRSFGDGGVAMAADGGLFGPRYAAEGIGMVSGATFTDLDVDGRPDLALAMEWGPVRIFHNLGGRFEEETAARGLAALTGWWTSIATGDFDGQRINTVKLPTGWFVSFSTFFTDDENAIQSAKITMYFIWLFWRIILFFAKFTLRKL